MSDPAPDVAEDACEDCGHPLDDHLLLDTASVIAGGITCPVESCDCRIEWTLDQATGESVRKLGGLEGGTTLRTFRIKVAQVRAEVGAETIGAIHDKFLVKTAIRSLVWLLVAAVIVYLFPDATWVWIVAGVFIVIGAAFALWAKLMQIKVKRRAEALRRE